MSVPADLDAHDELRLVPALHEVSGEALTELASAVVQHRLHAQGALVEQGSVSPSLQFLVRGAAKVVRIARSKIGPAPSNGLAARPAPASGGPPGESLIVLDVMRAPCLVGDASVIDGHAAFASVVTLRSSHVLSVDRRTLLKLCALHPSLARAITTRLAQEVRALVRRVDEVVAGPVDERVKHLLESLAVQHGTPLGQGRFIAIPLRRRDIACMVNATTETVSRLLAKFEREGLARSTRDGIWWRTTARPTPVPARDEGNEVAPGPSVALPRDGRG